MKLEVGQKASRTITVTDQMVEQYADLTGDRNPLHFDDEFCRRTRFGERIAQGGITTGLINALIAMDLPGPGSVFLSQNYKTTIVCQSHQESLESICHSEKTLVVAALAARKRLKPSLPA